MNKYSILKQRSPLPAGTYYIGDPCYVIKDDEWMQALEETNYFNMFPSKAATRDHEYNKSGTQYGVFSYEIHGINGKYVFAASSTAYGDGEYHCEKDGSTIGMCGVDAGLIAAIPIEMIEDYGDDSGLDLGLVYDFDHDFYINYSDGAIGFGDVIVHTEDDGDEGW